MNWETAKTWLIGLFLILDVLLGWQLYSSRQVASGYAESQTDLLANTKTLLAEHGLTLASDVPTKQPELASFQAQVAKPGLKKLVKAIFPNAKTIDVANAYDQATTNIGQITLLPDGSWQVTFNKIQPLTSKQGPISYAYQGNEYTEDSVSSSDKHMTFMQSYKSYPIFDAQFSTTQIRGGLLSFTQIEINSIRPTGAPKPVISALDALDSLANSVDKTGNGGDNKILKVDLGYARKMPLYQSGAAENYWFPVWRVVTKIQTYYVNAFTGEVGLAP